MLRKLMKHELRATGRIMLPIFLIVLLTAVGANLSSRLLLEMDIRFLNVVGIILLCAFFVAIIGSCIAAFLVMLQRFYKNLLQDEGYIMMTLPVSIHQLVLSKILTSIIWYAGTAITFIFSMLILAFDIDLIKNLSTGLYVLFRSLSFSSELLVNLPLIIIEVFLLLIIGCAGACLQFYAALSIGHSFSNHKMLGSVIIYFVIQFIFQLIVGSFFALMNYNAWDYALTQVLPPLSVIGGVHLLMCIAIFVALIHAAIFYFITTYFLKNRLNLE